MPEVFTKPVRFSPVPSPETDLRLQAGADHVAEALVDQRLQLAGVGKDPLRGRDERS